MRNCFVYLHHHSLLLCLTSLNTETNFLKKILLSSSPLLPPATLPHLMTAALFSCDVPLSPAVSMTTMTMASSMSSMTLRCVCVFIIPLRELNQMFLFVSFSRGVLTSSIASLSWGHTCGQLSLSFYFPFSEWVRCSSGHGQSSYGSPGDGQTTRRGHWPGRLPLTSSTTLRCIIDVTGKRLTLSSPSRPV